MSRFSKLLNNINERLQVPQPQKSRIILEIANDIEGFYEYYLESGLTENEAMEKVEERYNFSNEALSQLFSVHESFVQKLLNRFPQQVKTRWERFMLMALFFVFIFSGTFALVSTPFLQTASSFVWPVFGIGFSAILVSLFNLYKLYIKKDHNLKKIHTDLSTITFLAGLIILIGVWGYFFEHFIGGPTTPVSSLISVLFLKKAQLAHDNLLMISDCLIKSSSVIISGLFVLIIISFLLFIQTNKIQKVEFAEAMLYLKNN